PSVVTALYKSVLVQDPVTDQATPTPPGKKSKKDETVTAAKKEDPIIEISHIMIETEEEDPLELPPGKKPKILATRETILKSLGGNQKNILIVVKDTNVTYLSDEDLE